MLHGVLGMRDASICKSGMSWMQPAHKGQTTGGQKVLKQCVCVPLYWMFLDEKGGV